MKNKNAINLKTFRSLFLLASVLIICAACSSASDNKNDNTKSSKIDGVWKLTHFYKLADGDTIMTDTKKIQHKIYLDGYVIWNVNATSDASEWHGYGTFTFKNDTITEVLTSMSKSMKSDVTKYVSPIILGKNTYKQVLRYENNGINYQHIEVYKKLN